MLLRSIVAALIAGLVLEVVANPLSSQVVRKRVVPTSHRLHERHLSHLSHQWNRRAKLPRSQILPMRIGLKQRNLEEGHDRLMDISTPGSENFGKHMTGEEVIDFFAPSSETYAAVAEWLVDAGISADRFSVSVNKQWVQFDATVAEVENLLIADFYVWEHSSGSHDISTQAYHVPKHIQEHIDYITPGTRLRQRSTKNSKSQKRDVKHDTVVKPLITRLPGFPHPNSTTCDVYITKECTQAQYNIPNATTAIKGNELGIFESLDVHYSRKDLDIYYTNLYPWIPNGTYPREDLIDGAIGAVETTDQFVPIDLEAPLDFDSAQPLIYPQGLVLYQVDDEYYESTGNFSGFFNTFLDALDGSYCTYSAFGETGNSDDPDFLDPVYPNPNPGGYKGELQCGVYTPTNVISVSYGGGEAYFPDNYIKRQCNEWMKLALQGTTVVMSSGDGGVGGDDCFGPKGNIFVPIYGASCPYVLAVGSTELDRIDPAVPPTPYQKLNEIATKRFPSGGGFSNVFGVAGYQRDAVQAYWDQVQDSLPFKGYHHYIDNGDFNTTNGVYHHGGRGYPDVAAIGDRQLVYSNGSWYRVGGTSLSAPIWGAVLTLINEERLAAGKGPMGYIHPTLYAHPEAFTDITVGDNPGCNTTGFPTAKGWDPVTGLGSPIFPVLMDVLTKL